MDASSNITTILFTKEFKEDIKQIQSTGLIEELRCGEIGHLMEAQQRIRDYITEHYSKYIKKRFPDYYAMLMCLVVDIDRFNKWEDFTDVFYPNLPFIGSGYYETQSDYKCCCSHNVSSNNTTIVSYNGYFLVMGDVCILKSSIVSNFKEFKKQKKKQQEMNQVIKNSLLYEIQTYASKKEAKRLQEYNDSHRVCSCGKPCGKFLKCFHCKVEKEDKCHCGKWKQKKYKRCFNCSKCS